MKAPFHRLVRWIGRIVARRQEPSPIERLVTLILLNAKRKDVPRIVIEYREDGDTSSWPAERPLDIETLAKLDAEFDDNEADYAEEDASRQGACGVLYYPRGDDPFCEMRPPSLLWGAIRDHLLDSSGIDPDRCARYRNGYRYHGRAAELIEGCLQLVLETKKKTLDFLVRYEVDYSAEQVTIEVREGQ